MKIIFDLIGALMLSIAIMFSMLQILNLKINQLKYSKYITSTIIITIYLIISYYSTMMFLRYFLFIIAISIVFFTINKKSFKQSFIASFLSWILIVISELLFALLTVLIFKINLDTLHGILISNISVSIILIIFVKTKYIKCFLQQLLIKISESEKYYLTIIIIVLALSISIIIYINYFNISPQSKLVLSLIDIIIYTVITIILFNEKNNNNKIQYRYENMSKNLEEYEKMLDYQRVANHENKNQLLVIKGMIKKNEKDIDKYIDSIVKEKREDNEDFYTKTKRIPSGGLQGLIYYKLLIMKDKNINVCLDINSNVRKVNLENLGVNVNKDLCKIIGVLIDNAIQAVENLKEKNIDINMFFDEEKLNISISNNFSGNVDFSKIDEIGYTTKGTGHGYGLSLVKKIVNKNELFKNYKTINGNTFTQNIIIKIKK